MKKPDCFKCDFVICDDCVPMQQYEAYLEKRRKFRKGEPIKSFDEAITQEWVYIFGKPKHNAFVISLPVRTLRMCVQRGGVFYAIRKVDEELKEEI